MVPLLGTVLLVCRSAKTVVIIITATIAKAAARYFLFRAILFRRPSYLMLNPNKNSEMEILSTNEYSEST
jgi:hypothetical protein